MSSQGFIISDGASNHEGYHCSPRLGCRVEPSPSLHQFTTFLQRVPSAIGPLDRVTHEVSQSCFGDFTRKVGALASPVAEGATESVHGGLDVHASKNRLHRHIGERSPSLQAGEDVLARLDFL